MSPEQATFDLDDKEDVVLTVAANIAGLEVEIDDVFLLEDGKEPAKWTADTDYSVDDDEITVSKDGAMGSLTKGKYGLLIVTNWDEHIVELDVIQA